MGGTAALRSVNKKFFRRITVLQLSYTNVYGYTWDFVAKSAYLMMNFFNRFINTYMIHRAQVHIKAHWGCGVRSEKTEKDDLSSLDMVIKIKVVKFECTMEHSNISSYCYSFHTS